MLREISESDFKVKASKSAPELVAACFTNESTLTNQTKLVIVGTITPPNTSYFYCSYPNRIYGYIDATFKEMNYDEESLKELKIGLSQYKSKTKTINLLSKTEIDNRVKKIKDILNSHNIAFLDVMKNAIRTKVSSSDNDIEYYVLAKDKFDQIPDGAVVIANSRLAEECVNKIGVKNVNFISQRFGTKREWIDAIKEALQ